MKRVFVPFATIVALTGCIGTSPPMHYYTLAAEEGTGRSKGGARVIAIGPIDVPDYLDRTNVVSRTGPNQLEISDLEAWAEPLTAGTARVLTQNINSHANGSAWVASSEATSNAEVRVPIAIQQFECINRSRCAVRLEWRVLDDSSNTLVRRSASETEELPPSSTTAEEASALSHLLAKVAREMWQSISGLPEPR
jgi:uncharacterized lipoprotein YmbA